MNYTMGTYKHKFCYDHPVMDIYGAVAAILIWAFIINGLTNFKLNILEVDNTRVAELNQKIEDMDVEVMNLTNENEALDEKLCVALEQLRVARELNEKRAALINNCHNAMNSFVSLFPPEHDTQG